MSDRDVELDQHLEASRQVSALLSAALAAAQAGAQVAAQRARDNTRHADQHTRAAEQLTRDQQRQLTRAEVAAQRQLERQHRTQQALRHRQWGLKPSAQWLHDNPLSAAAAWASADVHRGADPAAARHAEQWETVFTQQGIDIDDVRAKAPAAVAGAAEQGEHAAPPTGTTTEPVEVLGELAAAQVANAAVAAGALDVTTAETAAGQAPAPGSPAGSSPWSAYADGAPAAALGGRGVSTPPNQVLSQARATPDLAATDTHGAGRAVELVNSSGLDR